MPTRITHEQVIAVAALAELELSASEVESLAKQLGDILEHAAEVQRVDTTGIAPTASAVTRHLSDRDDLVAPCLDAAAALANAPDAAREAGFFRVPRVIG